MGTSELMAAVPSYVTPILQHDPVLRIRYISMYPYQIRLGAFNFRRKVAYPRIRIRPMLIRVSVSVLHRCQETPLFENFRQDDEQTPPLSTAKLPVQNKF